MTQDEMRELIRGVCQQFQRDTGTSVTDQATDALFEPTVSHLPGVTRELRENRISRAFLQRSVRTVLENAQPFAKEREHRYIGFQDVRDSMAQECPYVFWC